MKKLFITMMSLVSLLSLTNAKAQGGEGLYLNGYAAYVFDDSFDSYFDPPQYYAGKINGGLQWGVGLEYRMQPVMGIELLYLRQDTNAPTDYVPEFIVQHTDFDLGINYIMVGGKRHIPLGTGKTEANFGLMAGMVIADLTNPDNGRSDTATKFAWGLRGGFTVWGSDRVGVMMQAQLLSAVQSMGGGFYFGTGGAGAGLSSYSTIYQFSLGGGLTFKRN